MSDSIDPFGASKKSMIFDPDAPIPKTKAANQFIQEFPTETESTDDTKENINSNQPIIPTRKQASTYTSTDPPTTAPSTRPSASSAAATEKSSISKFLAAKKMATTSSSSAAGNNDDVVIAVPIARKQAGTYQIEEQPATTAAAASAPGGPSIPTTTTNSSSSVKSSPTTTATTTSNASGLDLEANPFGRPSKSSVFDPDAPIAKTQAASQFMSEFPPETDSNNINEDEAKSSSELNQTKSKPLKPKPKLAAKKPTAVKKSTDASTAPTTTTTTAPISNDESSTPSVNRVLTNSPPLKTGGSSSTSSTVTSVPISMDSEFPTDETGGEDVFTGPIESRLVHKNWKARVQAYEEMKELLNGVSDDDDDGRRTITERFEPFLKKMVNDVSVPAYEAGLQAAGAWIDKASYDHGGMNHAEEFMNSILKKGFSGRPGTKAAADQIAILLVECGANEIVLTHLITGCQSPIPKIASSCGALLVTLLSSFGPGVIPFDKLQKFLPKFLGHTNAAVRKEAMELACELYKWMGAIFTNQLKTLNLKSSQEKELEGLFEKVVQGQARPTKFVRSQAASSSSSSGGGKKGKGGGAPDAAFDPMSLVKPVDLSTKLSKGWCDKVVNEKKWQDRKERLVELLTLADATPKIELSPGCVDIISALKKCIKDSNVVIVGEALKCLHSLVKGTKRAFYPHARQLIPVLIQLLKEKKSTVSQPVTQCLDTMAELGVIEIPEVLDSLVEGLSDKVSKVRLEVGQYVQRWLSQPRVTDKVLKDSIKPLGEALYKVLNDAEKDVRDVGTAAFAELIATVGRKSFTDLLKKCETTELKRYQKLEELIKASKKNGATSGASEGSDAIENDHKSTSSSTTSLVTSASSTSSSTTAAVGASKKSQLGASMKRPQTAAPTATHTTNAHDDDKKETTTKSFASSSAMGTKSRPGSVGLGRPSRVERHASTSSIQAGDIKPDVVDSDGPIQRIDLSSKAQRIKRDTKRVKGSFREWGQDEIEEMNVALKNFTSDELHGLLFHKDFVKQIAGLDILETHIDTHYDGLVSVSDLLFKWIGWRLCDANTSLLMKVLTFTHKFLTALVSHDYKLSEGEATNFIPFIIEKVFGHNTDRFRLEARELITITQTIYPPKSIFAFLLIGYESKNKRVFSECLNESGSMIVKYGIQVCDIKKVLITMAQTVGANESHVRTAALTALATVYSILGEGIWTHLGAKVNNAKIQPKQMAMIEARFKTIKPLVTATPTTSTTSSPEESMTSNPPMAAPVTTREPAPKTPSRTRLPNSSPSGSPQTSRSAQVSPRHSLTTNTSLASTTSSTNPPTPKRSGVAKQLVMPGGRTAASSAPTSAGVTLDDANGLPNCFSLDLEAHDAQLTHTLDLTHLSRTAPSSPGHQRTQSTNSSSTQSATTSPHKPTMSMGSGSMINSQLFAKSLGKPQLIVPNSTNHRAQTDPSLIEQLVHYMSSPYSLHLSDDDKMDVMKQLWEIVLDRATVLVGQGDQIVAFLLQQVEACFIEIDGVLTINHRMCRYALNTILELFKVEEVASGVKMKSVHHIVRLMDDRLKSHPDQQCRSLTMAVNVLVLKVLENGDRTAIFQILLNSMQIGIGSGSLDDNKNKIFIDLVVRSLMKLAKNLNTGTFIDTLNIPILLRTIHEFMITHTNTNPLPSPTSTGATGGPVGDDLPIKAIKAILSNLVNAKDTAIRQECIASGIPTNSPAMIYIEKMLSYNTKQKLAAENNANKSTTPTATTAPATKSNTSAAVPVTSTTPAVNTTMAPAPTPQPTPPPPTITPTVEPLPSDPIELLLHDIVGRTIKPATTQTALKELYEFSQAHPTIDIWPAFKQQGESFRAYVKRSLARMEQDHANGGQTPITANGPINTTGMRHSRPSSLVPTIPNNFGGSASTTTSPTRLSLTPTPTDQPIGADSVDGSVSGPIATSTSTAIYRQRLSQLQDRAKMATTNLNQEPVTNSTPPTGTIAQPTTTNAQGVNNSKAAPPTVISSGSRTIDDIRARFKSSSSVNRTSVVPTDENSLSASNLQTNPIPITTNPAQVLTPLVQQQPTAAPTKSSTINSIDAIKARIAAMNKSTTQTQQQP